MYSLNHRVSWLLPVVLMPLVCSAPVQPNKGTGEQDMDGVNHDEIEDNLLLLEYESYFKDVIGILTSDPNVQNELTKLNIEDIKSGNIGHIIEIAHQEVRDRLHELKRQEVQRLRTIFSKMMTHMKDFKDTRPEVQKKIIEHLQSMSGHVDMKGDNFDAEDINKLLQKVHKDMEEINRNRKDEFKKSMMEKQIQRRKELKGMSEEEQQQKIEEWKQEHKKRQQHEKVNHPGSRKQLEEVWEETDHLDKQDFNPKTFFALHDTNGDGQLDIPELEALFLKEAKKIYINDTDPTEMYEEMARMREHVFNEVDKDKNDMISLEEFIDSLQPVNLKKQQEDEGWEDLEDNPLYTDEEVDEYEKSLQELQDRLTEKLDKIKQDKIDRQKQLQQKDEQLKFQPEDNEANVAKQQGEANVIKMNQDQHMKTY